MSLRKVIFSHLFDGELPNIDSDSFDLFLYVVNGLQQIYSQLDIEYDEFSKYAFDLFKTIAASEKSQRRTIALGVLSEIVSAEDVIKCLHMIDNYSETVCRQLLQRCLVENVIVDVEIFTKILEVATSDIQKLLQQILDFKLVKIEIVDVTKLASSIIGKEAFFIESCMRIKGLTNSIQPVLRDSGSNYQDYNCDAFAEGNR